MDEKINSMIEEIEEIIEVVNDGARFAITKGMAGMDVSKETSKLIVDLLEQYLQEES
jgi:CRISPR/Cas system-associated protein Cas7 (RAMP superfamily)